MRLVAKTARAAMPQPRSTTTNRVDCGIGEQLLLRSKKNKGKLSAERGKKRDCQGERVELAIVRQIQLRQTSAQMYTLPMPC